MGSMSVKRQFCILLFVIGLLLSACAGGTPRRDSSPSPASDTPLSSPSLNALTWNRIAANGPSARRDFSFTGSSDGSRAFLFGGRSGVKALNDFWILDLAAKTWNQITTAGPSARFGQNAAFIDGRLILFGGQGGPSEFFNDVWSFDPAGQTWTELKPASGPSPRYGAGSTLVDNRFLISHGFTNDGRFDDTWAYSVGNPERSPVGKPERSEQAWSEGSPSGGPRPLKRCLLRMAWLESKSRVVLFGGQSNQNPFLGDTWEYDPAAKRWAEVKVEGPSPRNLYGMGATRDRIYLFGGADEKGPRDDLWSFDGSRWTEVGVGGDKTAARSGIEAATAGGGLLIFGGSGASEELNDLWLLSFP